MNRFSVFFLLVLWCFAVSQETEVGSEIAEVALTSSPDDSKEVLTDESERSPVGIVDPLQKDAKTGQVAAFTTSMLMIISSEIGDKTFFIAAIMSMTHSRVTVFSGAISALAVMTILSTAVGSTLPNLLPHSVTHAVSIVLFLFFGLKLLKEVYDHDPKATKNEELEEVEQELEAKEAKKSDLESGVAEQAKDVPTKQQSLLSMSRYFSPIFLTSFTMTFFAEWGDRSQIATIVLASTKDAVGVTLGGILGHAICTGMAVIGGKLLATRISERMVCLMGGILFLFFALHSFLYPEE
jgi:putative Ca2+/H+ antiporter (TMEM165/GDT1 family)